MKIIVALGLLFSSLGFALTLPIPPHATSDADVCPDFSGTWKGTCTDASGKTTQDTQTFTQQGCDTLASSNLSFNIGGTKTTIDSYGAGASMTSSMTAKWTDDKKGLDLAMIGLFVGPSSTTAYHYQGQVRGDGKKLNFQLNTEDGKLLYGCLYEKL